MDTRVRRLSLLALGLCVFVVWPGMVSGLILCDGDCGEGEVLSGENEICSAFDAETRIPVMGLFPCNVPSFRARGLTVAAQMAVRAIIRNNSILPGYRLDLKFSNTQVLNGDREGCVYVACQLQFSNNLEYTCDVVNQNGIIMALETVYSGKDMPLCLSWKEGDK